MASLSRWDTDFVNATFLDCDPIRVVDPPHAEHVMIWIDVEGQTRKVILSRDSAERLLTDVAECLEAFDSGGD